MYTRSLLLRLLVLFCATLLISCSQSKRDSHTISFGLSDSVRTLDVRFATDANSFRVCQLLYKAPVHFNNAGQPIPWLTSWKKISNRHYRFTIVGEPTFADGEPITSQDIQATYASVLDVSVASPHRGSLAHIQQIKIISQKQLDFILSKDDALFPAAMVIGILPKNWLLTEGEGVAPSSGDFVLEKDWEEGHDLWLRKRNSPLKVRFVTSRDPTLQAVKLLKGELDILQSDLPHELTTWLEQHDSLKIERAKGSNYAYIGFNLRDPILKQKAVREAIAYGINRKAIIQYLFAGKARPAVGLFPPDSWLGIKSAPFAYNPEKAKKLLKGLGYDEENPLILRYKTSKNPLRLRVASFMQDQLAAINIKLTIQSYDWGTFYGDIKAGRFQLYSLAWVGIKSPDIFRYIFHSSALPPVGANRGSYVSHEIDQLIEKMEQTNALEKKIALVKAIQKQILIDLPYIPLWYEDRVAIMHRSVKGYKPASDGSYLSLRDL